MTNLASNCWWGPNQSDNRMHDCTESTHFDEAARRDKSEQFVVVEAWDEQTGAWQTVDEATSIANALEMIGQFKRQDNRMYSFVEFLRVVI